MPRFILDSYEECRGPPRLFTLDKYDICWHRFQLVHCCLPLQHLPPRLHPPLVHVAAALSLGRLFLRRPPLFLSSYICRWPLLAAAAASSRSSSLLPATAASASPSPPTTASRRCCPLPRLPLPLPATSVPILPATAAGHPYHLLPSLVVHTKSRCCSPAAPAFCSQPLPPAVTTAALVFSSKKIAAAALTGHSAALSSNLLCFLWLFHPLLPLPSCNTAIALLFIARQPLAGPSPLSLAAPTRCPFPILLCNTPAAFPCLLRCFHYHRPDLNSAQPASTLLPTLPDFHPSAPCSHAASRCPSLPLLPFSSSIVAAIEPSSAAAAALNPQHPQPMQQQKQGSNLSTS
ncbi:hypothetical protein BHM03_00020284 [Ensete ventricosum]|nr:hypothetical protein BHM03_00020284 [Ensete ventricosum]